MGVSTPTGPRSIAPPGVPSGLSCPARVSAKNAALSARNQTFGLGQVGLVVDGVDLAQEAARAAVHAFVRVDVHRTIALIDAIHGAFLLACLVLDVDAGTGDYVGHDPNYICYFAVADISGGHVAWDQSPESFGSPSTHELTRDVAPARRVCPVVGRIAAFAVDLHGRAAMGARVDWYMTVTPSLVNFGRPRSSPAGFGSVHPCAVKARAMSPKYLGVSLQARNVEIGQSPPGRAERPACQDIKR